jgi:hypothetical protein
MFIYITGVDLGFQVRGGTLKKIVRAEGGANIFGVFRVKNHDFRPKNHIFSNFRGGTWSVYMYIYWPSPQFTGPNAMLHFLMSYLLYIVILQYVCKTGNIIPGTGQTSVHTPIMLCRGRSRGGGAPSTCPP